MRRYCNRHIMSVQLFSTDGWPLKAANGHIMSVWHDKMRIAEDAADGAADDGGICRWLQQMIWRRSLLWMSLCTDCDRLSYLRTMAPFGPIIWCMPWCIWWHLALYIWYIGHSLLYLCVQKNITFMFVSMHSLFDYDRKDDMIRDSLVTSSISNGPLYMRVFIPSSSRSFTCWRRIWASQELGNAQMRDDI